MIVLQTIAMVLTVVSMLLIGRTGVDQKRGLWMNTGAGVLWVICSIALASWPLAIQTVIIMAFNLHNLRRLSR